MKFSSGAFELLRSHKAVHFSQWPTAPSYKARGCNEVALSGWAVRCWQGWLKSRSDDEQRNLRTLFDGSFSSLLRFVEGHVASASDYSQLWTVSQTCALLDGLLFLGDDRHQIAAAYNRYERLYVFAFLWSFGVLLQSDARAQLEEFIRNHDKIVLDLPPAAANNTTLFDYMVDNRGEYKSVLLLHAR